MRKTKRILAALSALTLVGSMSLSAFADPSSNTGIPVDGEGSATASDIYSITFPTADSMGFTLDPSGWLSTTATNTSAVVDADKGKIVHDGAVIVNNSSCALDIDVAVKVAGDVNVVDKADVDKGLEDFNVYMTVAFGGASNNKPVVAGTGTGSNPFSGATVTNHTAACGYKAAVTTCDCANQFSHDQDCPLDAGAACTASPVHTAQPKLYDINKADSAEFNFVVPGATYAITKTPAVAGTAGSPATGAHNYAHAASGCEYSDINENTTYDASTDPSIGAAGTGVCPGYNSVVCTMVDNGNYVPAVDPTLGTPATATIGNMTADTGSGIQIQIGGICNKNALWQEKFFDASANKSVSVETVFSYTRATVAAVAQTDVDGAFGMKGNSFGYGFVSAGAVTITDGAVTISNGNALTVGLNLPQGVSLTGATLSRVIDNGSPVDQANCFTLTTSSLTINSTIMGWLSSSCKGKDITFILTVGNERYSFDVISA